MLELSLEYWWVTICVLSLFMTCLSFTQNLEFIFLKVVVIRKTPESKAKSTKKLKNRATCMNTVGDATKTDIFQKKCQPQWWRSRKEGSRNFFFGLRTVWKQKLKWNKRVFAENLEQLLNRDLDKRCLKNSNWKEQNITIQGETSEFSTIKLVLGNDQSCCTGPLF